MTLLLPPLPAEGFVDVMPVGDLPAGQQRVFRFGMESILFAHTDAGIFAVRDLCPHAFQPIAGGKMRGSQIVCPKHGARFDLSTGKAVNGVTPKPLTCYVILVEDGRILVARRNT